jgi:hypothetical protein
VKVLVNGAALVVNGDDTPASFDHGAVWVPVRALSEQLGLQIAHVDGSDCYLQKPDGAERCVQLDIIGKTGFSPVRPVAEFAGYALAWDAAKQTVSLQQAA